MTGIHQTTSRSLNQLPGTVSFHHFMDLYNNSQLASSFLKIFDACTDKLSIFLDVCQSHRPPVCGCRPPASPGRRENLEAEPPVQIRLWPDGAQSQVLLHYCQVVLGPLPVHQLAVRDAEPAPGEEKEIMRPL